MAISGRASDWILVDPPSRAQPQECVPEPSAGSITAELQDPIPFEDSPALGASVAVASAAAFMAVEGAAIDKP